MSSSPKLRMTRQRRTILEELRKVNSHPSADEIYKMVRSRLPRISLGTVYRNLEKLSVQGMIQKLELGGSQKRFDGTPTNHYHVRCVCCGGVEDAAVDPVAVHAGAVEKASNYKIMGHRLEFVGLCPSCKRKQPARGSVTHETK